MPFIGKRGRHGRKYETEYESARSVEAVGIDFRL